MNPGPRRIVTASLLFLTAFSADAVTTAVRFSGARRLSFNDGWRFFKGDAPGAERPDFQDAQWTQLQLPSGWAIEDPFDPQINPHPGALPIFGTGWYRKWFTLPANAKDRFFS